MRTAVMCLPSISLVKVVFVYLFVKAALILHIGLLVVVFL